MTSRALNLLFVVSFILSAVACGGSDSKDDNSVKSKDSGSSDDAVVGESKGQGGKASKGGAGGEGASGGIADSGTAGNGSATCPNGILEKDLGEVCDDGNFNDNDGCTSLCEYTCTKDETCDDGKPCNGKETCDVKQHRCQPGENLKDHETCGPGQSCYDSVCLQDACGDKWTKGTEECDDGNKVSNDGCTTKCKFTCLSTDPSRNCSTLEYAQCGPPKVCNDKTHMCEVGASQTAVSEKTACNLNGVDGAGWCLGGECVPTNCGDGQVGGNEECDLGDKNGVPESGCTKDCKTQKCGNKIVEGTEECDDGNREDLDTCDKSCKSEFWYRYTMMSITKETAPDWCVYSTKNTGDPTSGGNQFGNAFAGDVSIPGTGTATTPAMKINIVDTINQLLTSVFTSCQSNVLNKVVDSDDVSFQTTDESIGVAVYDGALDPAESSSRCGNVDTRFSIRVGKDQDATNPIVSSFSTAQRPGLISSIAPSDIVSQIPGIGTIKLYKLMVRIPVDMEPLSTPKAPPAVSETVKRPEKIGFNDANPKPDPYFPSGRLCAAVGVDSMKQVGVANTLDGADGSPLAICCKADATKFDQCNTAAGDVPGKNCDTFLDIMKYGCKICMKSLADGVPLCGSACDTEPIEIIRATQPDVDVDGDGAKDAYSAVIAAEAVRVRVTGIK